MKYLLLIFLSFVVLMSCEKKDAVSLQVADIENVVEVVKSLEHTLTLDKKEQIIYGSKRVYEIDGVYYLEMKSGKYVTTTLLKKGKNGNFRSMGISCTSSDCSGNSGCIPDSTGRSCTACTVAGQNGDCTKTVSGG